MRIAAVLQLGAKYISVAFQLVITAILARLISPEDFGVLAVTTVFISLFSLFSDMGIGTAIVQFRELDDKDYGRLFAFSVILGLGLTTAFCAVSPFIAMVYDQDQLVPLCCLASTSLLFSTLNMVPNGRMLRDKDFFSIGLRLIVATLMSGIIAVLLAFLGFKAYALVLQMVISSAIVFVWNILKKPIRFFDIHFSSSLKLVFSYSAYQFGFSLINFFSRNLDNLLLGKLLGVEALGYYDKAYKLTTYPLTAFSSVINSVIQPFMAEHQNNSDLVFSYWLKITRFFSLVAMPVAAACFCCASEVIQILFGSQWAESIPLFQILSISVYFQMVGNSCGAFFQSIGRTDLLFKNGLVNTAITVSFLLAGLWAGESVTVAIAISAAYCAHWVPISYYLIWRGFGKSITCLKELIPDIVYGVFAAVIVGGVGSWVSFDIVPSLIFKLFLLALLILPFYFVTRRIDLLTNVIGLRSEFRGDFQVESEKQ